MLIEMLYMVEHGIKPLGSGCGKSGDLKTSWGTSYSFHVDDLRKPQGSTNGNKTYSPCCSLEDHLLSDIHNRGCRIITHRIKEGSEIASSGGV